MNKICTIDPQWWTNISHRLYAQELHVIAIWGTIPWEQEYYTVYDIMDNGICTYNISNNK